MSLSLVRIDDRLIHGQVVLMWTKIRQGDALILLVDDTIYNDKFLKSVFIQGGNAVGKKVYIWNVAEATEKMPKAIASEKKYFLVAKNVQLLYQLRKNGVDWGDELIFGTLSKRPDTERMWNNVYCTKEDLKACDYLMEHGVEITFKLIPDEAGAKWKDIRKNYDY